MGHILFVILHLIAFAFGFIFLIITIPLHIIYAAVNKPVTNQGTKSKNPDMGGSNDVFIECPFCKMKIDKDATKCPHCQEWITNEQVKLVDDKGRKIKICIQCGAKNRSQDYTCIRCSNPLI